MAIPASEIVEIVPRVINGGSTNLEMNGLFITKNALIPWPRAVESFVSPEGVAAYFGPQSDEHFIAVRYFNGYVNKFRSPARILFGRDVTGGAQPFVRGDAAGSLAELHAITAGTLNVAVTGGAAETVNLTALDFSNAATQSAVAAVIQTALNAKASKKNAYAVAYDGGLNRFTISTTDAAATGDSIAVTGGDAADALGFAGAGVTASEGVAADALDYGALMDAFKTATENFVTFTTLANAPRETTEALAAWASAHWGYIHIGNYDADPASGNSLTDFLNTLDALSAANDDNTALVYGGPDYAAFIMGSIASIDWERANGVITLAFRRGEGLAATVADVNTADRILQANGNFYGKYATRNADFDFLHPGRLVKSDYLFIDPLVNAIWLNNHLQAGILNGLTKAQRVPYTERGYAMIRAWMMDSINKALTNGVIEAGVALSETQKSEVQQEAGLDISGELFTQGYFLQILDPGAQVRAQRGTPVVNLWYCYGGSVQRIVVNSTAIL